jgi:DnaK suppressor protein
MGTPLLQRGSRSPVTSSTRAPRSSHLRLPRLRSRGGWGAGSSDQPGRRNPRAASHKDDRALPQPKAPLKAERRVTGRPVEFLEAARAELLMQRTFRVHQMSQLDTALADIATDAARTEIHVALQEAARSVLDVIDKALHRIRQGKYGRCPRCGDALSLGRLGALPMAPLCGRCRRTEDVPDCLEPVPPSRGAPPVSGWPRPRSRRSAGSVPRRREVRLGSGGAGDLLREAAQGEHRG